jgi:hypothetical protein
MKQTAIVTFGKDATQLALTTTDGPHALLKQAHEADTPRKIQICLAASVICAGAEADDDSTYTLEEAAAMQATVQELVQDISGPGLTVEAGSSSEVVADNHLTVADMALAIEEMGADLETMEKQSGADKETIVALEQQNAVLEQRAAMFQRSAAMYQHRIAALEQEIAMLKGLMG